MSSPFHGVVIVGGGLGGLTLANILHNNAVPFTVYELDEHEVARAQGGSLDMHPESGSLALEEAGLLDDFNKIARPEDDDMKICGKEGEILVAFRPGPPENSDKSADSTSQPHDAIRPEIDRGQLRALLLSKIPKDVIKWGHRLTRISPSNHSYTLEFTTSAGSLNVSSEFVVGADGAWSQIRSLVSPEKPQYTGISFVNCHIDNIDAPDREDIAQFVGKGSLFAIDEGKGLFVQRNSGGRVVVNASLNVLDSWPETCGWPFDEKTSEATQKIKENLLGVFEGWSPKLRALIQIADAFAPRKIHMLPVGISWPHRRGVTLLGDAAHLMSPFAGEGANLAMLDGLLLGKAIVSGCSLSGDSEDINKRLDAAIEQYEKDLFPRAAEPARNSDYMLQHTLLVDGAGIGTALAAFKAAVAGGPPPS